MNVYKRSWLYIVVLVTFASAFGPYSSIEADDEVSKVSAVVRAGEAFGTITGTVNVMGKPTEGVKVSTDKNDFITVTDSDGRYTLPVTPNTYTVIAWFHGYKSVFKNDVKVRNKKTRTLNFNINKPLIFYEKTNVGSLRCKLCHSELYYSWKETFHAKSLRTVKDAPGVVRRAKKDFKNGLDLATVEAFSALNPAPVFAKDGGKFSVTIGNIAYRVDRTYGGNGFWKQRYLTKIGKSYYILPIQFNEATKDWVPYHLENWYDGSNEPLFDNPATLRNEINKTQSFEAKCAGCHNTGLSVKKNKRNEFVAKYTELNIGCESCHGPGSRHIVTQRREDVLNPRNLSYQRRQDLCGSCHSRGKSIFSIDSLRFGYPFSADKRPYTPGMSLRDYYTDGGGYWSQAFTDTKTSVKHHQQFSDLQQSGHAFVGSGCSDCHDAHGGSPGAKHMLRAPNDDNSLCLGCHGPDGHAMKTFADKDAIMEHTHHTPAYGIAGAKYNPKKTGVGRCSKCHMPKTSKSAVEWDIHDHTFDIVTPLVSKQMFDADPAQKIIPNSCLGCHGPKGPGTNWGSGDSRYTIAALKYTQLFGEPDYGNFGNITGVISANGAPLEGVRVSTDFEDTVTTTNYKGEYTLKLPSPGVFTVRAWMDGYMSTVQTDVKVDSTATADLAMQENVNEEKTYIGSSTCKVCHSSVFEKWQGSFHYTTLRNTFFGKGVVAHSLNNGLYDDFKKGLNMSILPAFSAFGVNAPILGFNEDTRKYTVTIGNVTYIVERTHGGHGFWKQRYQTNIGNSWYILPIQFNETTKEWTTYHPEHWYDAGNQPLYTNPETLAADVIKANAFERRCAGCHDTGLTNISIDNDDNYVTTYTEAYIGCESCHGPGSMHVATKNPEHILHPGDLPFEAADEVCGRCHSRGSSTVTLGGRTLGYPRISLQQSYQPGTDVLADLYNLVNPLQDPSKFWDTAFTETTTSKSHHQQLIDYKESAKYDFRFRKVLCFDCHDPHDSDNKHQIVESVVSSGVRIPTKTEDNTLCLGCHATHGAFEEITKAMVVDADLYHEEIAEVVRMHTMHQYNPSGTGESRCTTCHMPLVQKSAVKWDIHAHTFHIINPEVSLAMYESNPDQDIIPNSCNQCHVEWAGSEAGYQAGVEGFIERFGD